MVCVSPQGWVARSKHRLAEFVSCLSVCRSDIYEPVLAVLYVLFLIKPASSSQLVCIVQILHFENWKLFFLYHSCLSISILWVSKDTEAHVCVSIFNERIVENIHHFLTLMSFQAAWLSCICGMVRFCVISEFVLPYRRLWSTWGWNIPLTERNYCMFHKSLGWCAK